MADKFTEKFIYMIEDASTISIIGHLNPDGDCVGSCLGLYNYIIENFKGKKVDVFLEPIPKKFRFLENADKIKNEPVDTVYDLAISLDCGDTDRHRNFAPIFANAKETACIDHHRSNKGFGDYFFCDPDISSASEALLEHLDLDLVSLNTAECLYLGMVHDTGVFKYPATSEETMTYAGKLLAKGVNSQFIIDETFYKVSFKQNQLTAAAVLNAKLNYAGKVISTCVTREMFEQYDCTKEETEGIVDRLRITDGVEVAVFAYQLSSTHFKFSMRSISYVDVSVIASAFGGGGHIRAAGVEMDGTYEECLKKIFDMIEEQL